MNGSLNDIRILILEDDPTFRDGLVNYLESRRAEIQAVDNIQKARVSIDKFRPEIILLDKSLGSENGFKFIHEIRTDLKFRNLPILIITGTSSMDDKIDAFSFGADDLMVKPFELNELEVRIVALMRRSGSYNATFRDITLDRLSINLRNHEVFWDEKVVNLTETEYRILLELVINKNQVVYREQLAVKSLSARNTGPKTLNVHIASLRKKLGFELSNHIRTIRNRGFMYSERISMKIG